MSVTDKLPDLADIEAARARIEGNVRRTPMIGSQQLTERHGFPIHLKLEHLQRTGSFKIRGALNLVSQLGDDVRTTGVVAASAGNHAQGVAVAATAHGIPATVFMPQDATLSKVRATRAYGAQVELVGDTFADALEAAEEYARGRGAQFVHPYNDARIIAGQGTIGLEIVEDLPEVATVVIPIGGGGLFAGIATAIKALRPDVRCIGVQAEACSSVRASLDAGHPVAAEQQPTMADGIAVKQPGELTFQAILCVAKAIS